MANAEFLVGDAVELMPRMYAQGIRPDVFMQLRQFEDWIWQSGTLDD